MSTPAAPESIWWTEPGAESPALESELDVEIMIIGGGIAGLSLAHTLAEHSASVALLEAGPLAACASGRNAGFLTLSPPEPYRELIALWGREGARAALRLGRRSHQRIRQLVEQLGIDCDYRVAGSLRLARSEEEADDMRASLSDLHADGFPMLETPVAAAVPGTSASFHAAFVVAEDGELDPVRFLRGLALETVRRGGRLFTHSPLVSARWNGGLWEARTPSGAVRARTLVLATNAYSARLYPALEPLIAPRRGQMLCTAPIAREVATRPSAARWGYQYWRQLRDGRLVIGGWRDLDLDGEVGFDVQPTPNIQAAIEEGVRELVPEGVAIERRWAGTMGFARDGRPLVGWLDPEHHVAICGGFTGHGMSVAAACALDLAELLAWKRAPGIATLDPLRFAELREGRDRLTMLDVTRGAGL